MKLVIFAVVFYAVIIFWGIFKMKKHKNIIRNKIQTMNAQEISIKTCSFVTGPFKSSKGTYIYRFKYILDGKQKEGWVRFGPLSEDEEWVLK